MLSKIGIKRIVEPVGRVITVQEVKDNLRIDTDEDDLIESLIDAATIHTEKASNRQFLPATYRYTLDRFPYYELEIPYYGPVIEIQSVTYLDQDHEPQSFTNYFTDVTSDSASIYPVDYWPTTLCRPGSVQVVYRSGHETVPANVKHAVRLLVTHWFTQRAVTSETQQNEVPLGYNSLVALFSFPGA